MKFRNSVYLSIMAAAIIMLSACSNTKDKKESDSADLSSVPESVQSVVKALKENDSEKFAKLVSYPLERPYPLKDIEDEKGMKEYYNTLVDDSLRNIISSSKAENWGEYGWRGWSVDAGNYLWIDDELYAVNYVSGREKNLMDSLTNVEVQSLPAALKKGWKPILTMLSDNDSTVYRIDMRTEGKESGGHHYRLAVYNGGKKLLEKPDMLLDGVMEMEGTASNVTYIFHNKDGREFDIMPDHPSSGKPVLTLPNDSSIELNKAYWYELIKR